jgi:sugar/nucleoside kinase (ribokinase family)
MEPRESAGKLRTGVVVIGTTTVDLFLTGMERLPGAGSDEFTTENVAFLDRPPTMVLGGNAANSAYVLAGLDTPTSLCSVIGRDTLGALVLGWLKQRGVILDGVIQAETSATSSTTVAIDRSLHRLSFHHPGGSPEFSPEQVSLDLVSRTRCLLLTSYHLLAKFRREGGAELLAQGRRCGALTGLDIGPAIPPVADLGELSPLLRHVDYLLANAHEITACTGLRNLEQACSALLAAGAGTVVVKRGIEGASAFTRAGRIDASGFAVKTDFTVGAGDAFNAGFLHAVLTDGRVDRALRFANAVAALVVQAKNGVLGSPDAKEVCAFLARHARGAR